MWCSIFSIVSAGSVVLWVPGFETMPYTIDQASLKLTLLHRLLWNPNPPCLSLTNAGVTSMAITFIYLQSQQFFVLETTRS